MWRQRGLADGCYKGVARRHQAEAAAQRSHGQLRFQDVLGRRLVGAEDTRREEELNVRPVILLSSVSQLQFLKL